MSIQETYLKKRLSASDAVRLLRNGDFIISPTGVGEAPSLLTALSEQRHDFQDLRVAQILAMRKYGYIDRQTVENVRHVALFMAAPPARVDEKVGLISFRTISPRFRSRLSEDLSRLTWCSPWHRRWTRTVIFQSA